MRLKICVLGLGYIGLPTALLLAKNFEVLGVDVKYEIINLLNDGSLPFEEDGLEVLFEEVKDNFRASSKPECADIFVIAVPTPLDDSLKIADLKYVRRASEMISEYLNQGNLVILESTVPPGASDNIVIPSLSKSGLPVNSYMYVHCPERAIPGNTLDEMINNDRIIGSSNEKAGDLAAEVYSSFVKGKIFRTDVRTAEFIKLMENTSRDVSIAIANEFSLMATEFGINVWEAIDLANRHPRVNILKPGPGVGGHCIAIDPWFLAETSTTARMISLARTINDNMPNYTIKEVRTLLKGILEPVVSIFGVAYKGNVSDWRATPALKIIRLAENEGIKVKIYDPYVKDFPYNTESLENSLEGSDCIIIVTDHDIFREIDPSSLKMRNKNIFDARNIININKWENAGFNCKVLGNGSDKR